MVGSRPRLGKKMPARNLRLDSLRGIAASIVVFHHAINLCDLGLADRAFMPFASADLTGRALLSFISGGMAVNIFFILSGAVLTVSQGDHLRSWAIAKIERYKIPDKILFVCALLWDALARPIEGLRRR